VRRRGFHIVQTIGSKMAASSSVLRAVRSLPQGGSSGTHFCWSFNKLQGQVGPEGLVELKHLNNSLDIKPATLRFVA
jgi:hypothetical protein